MAYRFSLGKALALTMPAILLAACSTSPQRPPQTSDSVGTPGYESEAAPADDHRRNQVVNVAEQLLGTPYRYGGNTPSGFDCSGLVQYTHAQAGVQVPRVARAQHRYAQRVSLSMLKPGDLLFFRLTGKADHVGIYVGDGEFIHAPSSGKRVSRARLDNVYWRPRLVGAGTYVTPDQ